MTARLITETVFSAEQYDSNWPPEEFAAFREWLEDKREEIPEEFMASAMIQIDSKISYGQSLATIKVSYDRPETPQEVAARQAKEQARMGEQERQERALLEALQRKYEGTL